LKGYELWRDEEYSVQVKAIEKNLINYRHTFNELIYLFKFKGYKDYGIEGKMRDYVHEITNNKDPNIKYYSLLLRKHEKDFLIRKELSYITSFNSIIQQLISYVNKKSNLSHREKNKLFSLIYFYNKYFKIIARTEQKIGIKSKQGLLNISSKQ